MQPLNIAIVDDNKSFRESLRFFLEKILLHKVIVESDNGNHFLETTDSTTPDIVLMDIEMPGMNGIITTRELIKRNYPSKILAITNHQDKVYLKELITAGFKGIVLKNNIHKDLPIALDDLIKGKMHFPRGILKIK
ncbi:DNA-binding response regulator [Marinilabiliaceae bacterium JC017]|nr:DNA-binding response regulator [Marinilabiliaceae bacterium JC017]